MSPKPAPLLIRAWLRLWGFHGITLPPLGIYILAEHLHDDRLNRHERIHWAQYQRMGAVRFYATYLWQVLRYGYRNAPMEREARGET
jgi:hypothetical protein